MQRENRQIKWKPSETLALFPSLVPTIVASNKASASQAGDEEDSSLENGLGQEKKKNLQRLTF